MARSAVFIIPLGVALLFAPSRAASLDCHAWPDGNTLQWAVDNKTCVRVAAGTYLLDLPLKMKPGRALEGSGSAVRGGGDVTTLKANRAAFPIEHNTTLITTDNARGPRTVRNLTLDGANVASLVVGFTDFTLQYVHILNAACSGVHVADTTGASFFVLDAIIERNAWPTYIPERAQTVSCGSLNEDGNDWGAGIYQGGPGFPSAHLVVARTTIRENHGSAIDAHGSHTGYVTESKIYDNTGWAGVHLYGANDWAISHSEIFHTERTTFFPHHECYPAEGLKPAAVRACNGSQRVTVAHTTLSSPNGYALLLGGGSTVGTLVENLLCGIVSVP